MALRQYGLPYQGSKNQIAEEICMFLPEGERFVDLFGGGGAITHCAMQSCKWKSFLYNELNPLVFDTFKKALNGEFEEEFKNPKWISRDEFNERKNKDGFIALVWSFSNNMQSYLFGRNREESKRSIFEWVVNNRKDEFVNRLFPYETLEGDTWLERYREFMAIARDIDDLQMATLGQVEIEKVKCMQCLRNMKRVSALERINRIDNLFNSDELNIEFTNCSYEQFVHREGDVVYCDIPYESTDCKAYDGFDHKTFYDWCYTRDYQVFFSSYNQISDNRFYRVWERKKIALNDNKSNSHERVECIYSNMPYKKSLLDKQYQFGF